MDTKHRNGWIYFPMAIGFLLMPIFDVKGNGLLGVSFLHAFIFLGILVPAIFQSPLRRWRGVYFIFSFTFVLEMMGLAFFPSYTLWHLVLSINGVALVFINAVQLFDYLGVCGGIFVRKKANAKGILIQESSVSVN